MDTNEVGITIIIIITLKHTLIQKYVTTLDVRTKLVISAAEEHITLIRLVPLYHGRIKITERQ